MNAVECDRLDEYLDGSLPSGLCADFKAHCRECARCSDELRRQARLDCILAAAAKRPAPLPADLTATVRAYIQRKTHRRLICIGALSAAAAVCLTATTVWVLSPLSDGRVTEFTPWPTSRSQVNVTVEQTDDTIIVPIETQNPSVTLFWFYPTYDPASDADRPRSRSTL